MSCGYKAHAEILCPNFKNKTNYVEVKHSKWEKDANFSKIVNKYKCSLCGVEDIVLHHNYCPNCGAKMDLKEGTEE